MNSILSNRFLSMSAILKYILVTISIIEAIFIYTAPCPREGLNYMFLVPFFMEY